MHTLKTAIVVVLLLTVTYSAYVALTAPPAELPPELKEIVEASGSDGDFDLSIDPGLPDSLGMDPMLPPPLGAAQASDSADPSAAPEMGLPGFATGGSDPSISSGQEGADSLAHARLTDQKDLASHAPFSASQLGSSAAAPQSLPKPAGDTAPVSADPNQNYPSTSPEDLALDMELPTAIDSSAEDAAAANYSLPDFGSASPQVPESKITQTKLANAIATADRQCEQQQLREALATLSVFYNTPELSEEDRAPLLARLDYLAGEVVYSTRHLLEQPYRVSQGDTMKSIAATLEVPWELLATINGVSDPAAVVPGQQLKAIRGPFRAEVRLGRKEMTLFLGELYAGRFPVTLGNEPAPTAGSYAVLAKESKRTYYPLAGANVPGGDAHNPYGDVWLDLGQQMSIHGSPESPATPGAGCIQLRSADARDVSGILSQGSKVSILR